jgi:hypothetical protein
MAHMNQQIRDRVAAIIGALPFFSGRVYKMRSYALDEAKLPAAVVYTNRQSSSLVSIGFRTLQGSLNLTVDIHIKGFSATIVNEIDDACVLIEDAIGSDFSLNGLVKSCVLTETDVDINVEGEKPTASARLSYVAEYVTSIADVETPR